MKTTSNEEFAYAMTPLKFLSWPVGTWPFQVYDIFSLIRTIFSVSLLLLMIAIVQMELYLDRTDAENNLDALLLINCGILAVAKVMCFRIRSIGLVSNFSSAIKDYNELNSEENRVIVRRHAYMGRVACASLIFCSYVGSTLFMTVPMLAGDEQEVINVTEESAIKYPIPSKNILAIINMPENMYFVVFIIEYIMLLLTSTGNLGSDSLFFGIAFHLCGQVEILRLKYNKLSNENERTMKRVSLLTRRHVYLLKLSDMLNETISSILVIQLFSSCVLICTTGFEFILALSTGNIVMIIRICIAMSVLLIQLFAYSYVGEYLKTQTEGLGNSVYFCTWYDMPKNVSQNIIFIIMRAQHPFLLTAGKFFVVNMETYMSILKTSMSYLSVLRVMVNLTSSKKMKTTSNKDFTYAMIPLKFLSWPVGTWPFQVHEIFSISRTIFSISLLLLMVVILQMELYLDRSNAENNLDALLLINCGILAVAKVMCFRIRPIGLVSNFSSAIKDYNELNSEENRVIMRRHAYMSRVACASLISCSFFASTLFMTVPMLTGNKEDIINVTEKSIIKYPIPSKNALAIINMPENLSFMVFIVEYMMLLFTSTGNLGSDSLFFGIVFHLCGQVEILKLKYSKLSNTNERTMEHIILLIKRHIYLLNLSKMLNETVSSILVIQLFSSCVLICTTGFQLILTLTFGNVVLTIKILAEISILLIQLFAYSYVGEYLKTQTEGIGNSVYFCTWYDMPKNVSKDIIFIIMKSQRPVLLTAGKFFVVNMETYMSILRTSMSYLSVLRVMVNS
ncbi:uncharacterized protein LOC108002265 [Apis cerana]|uniref:uncharacterized protein LOC108002265 n=1 Tax=Apis cerana TaxID=7461 RepID=UPI002B239E5E|nr:uncharacterized protein LOC108002265 [Apis cerana]